MGVVRLLGKQTGVAWLEVAQLRAQLSGVVSQ